MKERLYKGFREAEKALANNKFDKQSAEDVRHLITSVREEFGDKRIRDRILAQRIEGF